MQNIAVIGSGISGISAAYMLSKKHKITIFESDCRLGGHTNTVKTKEGVMVDTGFIVFNELNYPHFCKFIDQLGVQSIESDMSFAYYDQSNEYAYSSDFPKGLFSTTSNVFSPQFYKFIMDIFRFNKLAVKLRSSLSDELTIYEFLIAHRFNEKFIKEYVLPMGAAIWSTSQNDIQKFPAKLFISFWENHRLLQVLNRPKWRTLKNGSISYINAVIEQCNLTIKLNHPVTKIERGLDEATIYSNEQKFKFDQVIIATHADQALKMLASPSDNEVRLLGKWMYSKNPTILHSDCSIAPKKRSAWASWIYARSNDDKMVASYYMNRLQALNSSKDYFVSLNIDDGILNDSIDYQTIYDHPMMTKHSVSTQPHLQDLNGNMNTFFCGSYFGNGFHEDGIASAVKVAKYFDCEL